jgi:hypothetical protein
VYRVTHPLRSHAVAPKAVVDSQIRRRFSPLKKPLTKWQQTFHGLLISPVERTSALLDMATDLQFFGRAATSVGPGFGWKLLE